MPRPEAPLGVWRAGYEPRPEEEPEQVPTSRIALGAVASLLGGWLLWSLLWSGLLGSYWLWPLLALTPDSWQGSMAYVVASYIYYGVVIALLVAFFGRFGWPELLRRGLRWARKQNAGGLVPGQRSPVPAPEDDPAAWGGLRRDGAIPEADRLAAELQSGAVSDVDVARILRAWRRARGDERRRAGLLEELRSRGSGAVVHGSGARDLPERAGRHDLVLHQVRLGEAVDQPRNPYQYRTAGFAVDPGLLSTGLLAVGPTGSGKTRKVVRPVVEAACLQALTGAATVVVVTERSSAATPNGWFDVVLDASVTSGAAVLDLYGSSNDPDEAAAIAAEALVGDLSGSLPGGDVRAAATVLAQLIGPCRAVHGRFPEIGELLDLLHGTEALQELRAAVKTKGVSGAQRELVAFERQITGPVVPMLTDRLALLDRPALTGLVSPSAAGDGPLDRLDRPVRVRVDLPDGVHAQAGRVLARLVLAHLATSLPRRGGDAPWACVVLDDATSTVTPQSVQALQRLRSANCGVVLGLRALADVPEALRPQLVSAVGCRAVLAGVAPWDAQHFATAWGEEVVEEVKITDREIYAEGAGQKAMHGLRKLATGRATTVQAVTKQRQRRQRWPASDLATELPGGHAVISVTAPDGQRSSPILIRLGS